MEYGPNARHPIIQAYGSWIRGLYPPLFQSPFRDFALGPHRVPCPPLPRVDQPACPQVFKTREQTDSPHRSDTPFTPSKFDSSHSAPAVISLLQFATTLLLLSKIPRIPSSRDNDFEFFENLVVGFRCRLGYFERIFCFFFWGELDESDDKLGMYPDESPSLTIRPFDIKIRFSG